MPLSGGELLVLGSHGLNQHHAAGPLGHSPGELGPPAVDKIADAEAHPAQDEHDHQVHRQHSHQGHHQLAVVAGDLAEHGVALVEPGKDGDKDLHNQGADGDDIGRNPAEQLLGLRTLIEGQGQADNLGPQHPPQVPADAGGADAADNAAGGADEQAQHGEEEVGQHHRRKAHVPGKELRAVLRGTDADVGQQHANRHIAQNPKIRQL